ncbi:hypothetical protein LTR36_005673 [Oleoguttula mirabilis]|uniref:Uncharacterized protein n=1 Tax=Oleoguttula mirabilis TaxID=1507867 RepID=A0AAV9JE68_9PEZI|nr:hypothetical protein LTR36_005673 [Oleoguttula mirabilis]
MPIAWQHAADKRLLVIVCTLQKPDWKAVEEQWARMFDQDVECGPIPTPRAMSEHIHKLRRSAMFPPKATAVSDKQVTSKKSSSASSKQQHKRSFPEQLEADEACDESRAEEQQHLGEAQPTTQTRPDQAAPIGSESESRHERPWKRTKQEAEIRESSADARDVAARGKGIAEDEEGEEMLPWQTDDFLT